MGGYLSWTYRTFAYTGGQTRKVREVSDRSYWDGPALGGKLQQNYYITRTDATDAPAGYHASATLKWETGLQREGLEFFSERPCLHLRWAGLPGSDQGAEGVHLGQRRW